MSAHTHMHIRTPTRFSGDAVGIQSSWAGLMDVHSLRDVAPPSWPTGAMELPGRSLTVVTFQLSTPQPFVPEQTQQQVTVYPTDYRTVMVPIQEGQTFTITVSLQVPLTLGFSPSATLVQFGVLGPPGRDQWKGVADCSTGVKVLLQELLQFLNHLYMLSRPMSYAPLLLGSTCIFGTSYYFPCSTSPLKDLVHFISSLLPHRSLEATASFIFNVSLLVVCCHVLYAHVQWVTPCTLCCRAAS